MLLLAVISFNTLLTWVTCAVVFTMTFLALYGLFNQPVQVRTSYQREAAILAGHTDRHTLFEVAWIQPIMWVLLSWPAACRRPSISTTCPHRHRAPTPIRSGVRCRTG